MYSDAANTLGFSTGGTNRLTIASTGAATFGNTLTIGGTTNMSGTDVTSVYTDARVQSAVTGTMIGYGVRMVALSPSSGSYTVANMYGIKTSTPVVQPNVTVTNSYGIYIGRTDDPTSGGVVTNRYALVTEANAGNVGIGGTPSEKLDVFGGGLAAGNGTIKTGITYGTYGLIGTFTNHDLGVIVNGSEKLRIVASTGAATFTDSITTGTPSGGTAKAWKLGQDTSTLYSATRTIQVEIDGGTYYLLAVKSTDL